MTGNQLSNFKVVQEVELIENVYWKCCIDTHRHKKRSAAQKCVDKSIRMANSPNKLKWTIEELDKLLEKRSNGQTYKSIGEDYNLSTSRIRILIERRERMIRKANYMNKLKEEIK